MQQHHEAGKVNWGCMHDRKQNSKVDRLLVLVTCASVHPWLHNQHRGMFVMTVCCRRTGVSAASFACGFCWKEKSTLVGVGCGRPWIDP